MTSDCHKELLKLDSVKTDVYIYIRIRLASLLSAGSSLSC